MTHPHFIISLLLLINFHISWAQNTFNVIIKDTAHDYCIRDAIETSDGKIILVTLKDSFDPQITSSELIKLSNHGQVLQRKEMKFEGFPSGFMSICLHSEFEFLLSGFIRSGDSTNLWLCVIDTALNVQMSKSVPIIGYNLFHARVLKNHNGNFICFGTLEDTSMYQQNFAFIYQFSPNLDSPKLQVFSNYWAWGLDLLERNDESGYYFIGVGFASVGQAGKVVTLDSNFNIITVTSLPPGVDNMSNIQYCDDKNLVVTGELRYTYPITQSRDIGVLKYDTMFNLIHSKAYGKKDTEDCPGFVKNIAVNSSNSIFIGGTGNLNFGALYANQPSWFMLNHTDTSLSLKWQKFYGGDGYYTLWGIIPTRDSGCLMYGTFWDYQHISEYVNYISVIKVNKDGLLLGTDGQPSALLKDVIIYPNPGNEKIWAVTGRLDAWIEFLDLKGTKIFGKSLNTGHTQIETSVLSPGMYIYRVFDKKGLIQTGKWIKE